MDNRAAENPPVDFGLLESDERLKKRAALLLARWGEKPGIGFPQVFENGAELEAAYRFFSNPALDFSGLLTPLVRDTARRSAELGELLVVEDTTLFSFGGSTPREGDIYDCFSTLVAQDKRFVIRCGKNRALQQSDSTLLLDALQGLPVRYRDEVTVSKRVGSKLPDQRKLYPARKGRVAKVKVTATAVVVKRTRNSSKELPAEAPLNLVHILETSPPKEQQPVEWVLLTSEPIDSEAELRKIVDIYRRRWLVEEFFKALKTGCAFEKRQLESYHALKNALAMALPIAWQMLLFRNQARDDSELPAKDWFDPLRLQVVAAMAKRYKLSENPTVRDVAYSIAGMGGWLKRNGPPGWLTLRRGFETLLMYEEAWIQARSEM